TGCAACRTTPAAPTSGSPRPWPTSPTACPASSRTCAASSSSCATGSRPSRKNSAPCARHSKRSPRRSTAANGKGPEMALARARRERRIDYWPGFVDALSTLLLAIMFLLSVFVLAQFLLSREVAGKDEVLNRLNSQINELTQLLALA